MKGKLEMLVIDKNNRLYHLFNRVMSRLVLEYDTAIDIGCGNCQHTKHLNLDLDFILHVDLEWPKEDKVAMKYLMENNFQQGDALDVLKEVGYFDVVIALDFIEHLTRERAYDLFKLINKLRIKRQIFFVPTGEGSLEKSQQVNPDHHSIWTPDDFLFMDFQVWHCPNYHPSLGIGAFLAWKTREISAGYFTNIIEGNDTI